MWRSSLNQTKMISLQLEKASFHGCCSAEPPYKLANRSTSSRRYRAQAGRGVIEGVKERFPWPVRRMALAAIQGGYSDAVSASLLLMPMLSLAY